MNTAKKTILVVDDAAHIRQLLQFGLAKIGCHVEVVKSGLEAVRRSEAGRVDLLVIDVEMTGMSGFETVREIRRDARYADMPVIMMTGRGLSRFRQEALDLGVSRFMTKPFSPIELAQQVKELLAL
jgi:two-component system OmpR family response regulator